MSYRPQSRRLFPVLATILFCLLLSPATSAPPKFTATDAARDLLTKHEDEEFKNQTVYISGQAFIRCKFVACTLVLRESAYHLQGCSFERCNWHIDCLINWGSDRMLNEIKALVTLMEQAQKQREDQKP